MAVTKRTRFEVLRRDNHTCQYCGAAAPGVQLQVDHVMPIALGGDDKPGNLVTACRDCNAGKSSIRPDAPLVQNLSAQASAYALGMQDKMTRLRADLEALNDYESEFRESWDVWTAGGKSVPLPADYQASLYRWMLTGVPVELFEMAVPVAMEKRNRERAMRPENVFAYMAGVVWNMFNQREIDYSVTEGTCAVYTAGEHEEGCEEAYGLGVRSGRARERRDAVALDVLRNHIDQTEPAQDEWGIRGIVRHGA